MIGILKLRNPTFDIKIQMAYIMEICAVGTSNMENHLSSMLFIYSLKLEEQQGLHLLHS